MKHVKRFLALAISGAAVFLSACGGSASASSGGSSAPADAASGESAPVSSGASGGKTYTIAMDTVFSPFEFEDASGNRVGIDVELLDAIAADQGVTFEKQALGFDAALAAVQAGQADAIMAGCSITEKRKEVMDFSEPYFDSGVAMGVAEDSAVTGYEDLKGQKVGAKVGTESATFLNGEEGKEGLKDKIGFEVVLFDDSPTMYEDVKVGNSIACFDDYPVLGYSIAQGSGLKMVTEMERGSSYGLGVKKGENADLLEVFNAGLKNLKESGKYQEILDKYIKK